ncbi:MAG: glycosyltransferase family 39 protein [Anaerolineales bacterium]|nr:glycosyltransferase family 39 protein [Anaerolineales bacterium]
MRVSYLISMRLRFSLRILLPAFFAIGFIYDQSTPIFEASDEAWHYGFVSEITSGRGLPIQRLGDLTTYRQEGSQPPLYYVLAAALTSWVDDNDVAGYYSYNPFAQVGVPGTSTNVNMFRRTYSEGFPVQGVPLAVHLLRFLSLGLGCGTVAITYMLARSLFPGHPAIALLAGAVVAFNPMVVFISASVNNDNGIWFLSSLIMYMLVIFVQDGVSVQRPLKRVLKPAFFPWVLGILLGLAILTKLSGLLLVPVIAVFLLWKAKREGNWRCFWRDSLIVGFCVVIMTGWWFYRNWVLYGEILGDTMMAQVYGFTRVGTVSLSDLMFEWRGWWYSLWGVFGAFNILPGNWVYVFFNTFVVLSICGVVKLFRTGRSYMGSNYDVRVAHGLMILFLALTIVGNIYWSLRQHALQGRHALGAVAVMSTYLAAGVVVLGGESREKLVAWIMTAVLFIVSLAVAIVYIAPRYSPPLPMMEMDIPSDIINTDATFDSVIELIGYSVPDDTFLPGDTMNVTLYWRGIDEIDADYNLALNVHGRNMENVGKLDTWPGGGLLPTGDWIPGVVYADYYSIPLVAQSSGPTLLHIDVSFWQESLNDRLVIRANESAIDSLMLDAGRLLPKGSAQEFVETKIGSTFASGITLVGYTVLSEVEEDSRIVLFWQAEESISGDWTVFMHLLNSDEKIVAQADGPPVQGDWPTSVWEPGHLVSDLRILAGSSGLSPGDYRVIVGLYDSVTGIRAAAYGTDGTEWADRAVSLLSVTVGE